VLWDSQDGIETLEGRYWGEDGGSFLGDAVSRLAAVRGRAGGVAGWCGGGGSKAHGYPIRSFLLSPAQEHVQEGFQVVGSSAPRSGLAVGCSAVLGDTNLHVARFRGKLRKLRGVTADVIPQSP